MSSYMQVEPLAVEPFMRIHEFDKNQVPVEDYTVWPRLAAAPRRVKFSETKDNMVAVFDLRLEFASTIGSDTDDTAGEGIRVFSPDDEWIVFGGTSTQDIRIFRKAGPGYLRYTDPVIRLEDDDLEVSFREDGPLKYAQFVEIEDKLRLIYVQHDTAADREVWSMLTWNETKERWSWPGVSTAMGEPGEIGVFTGLYVDPDRRIVVTPFKVASPAYESIRIVKVGSGTIGDLGDDYEPDFGEYFKDGRLVAVSPDLKDYVFTPNNVPADDLIVCRWVANAGKNDLVEADTIPASQGSNREGFYLPDGSMFIVTGTSYSGFDMPIWYTVKLGDYILTGGRDYEAAAGNFQGLASRDSDKVMVWSGTRLVVYEPGVFVGDDISDAADPIGLTAARPLTGTVPGKFSRDGRYFFTKTNTTANRYFFDGTTFGVTTSSGSGIPTNAAVLNYAIHPTGEYYVMAGSNSDGRSVSFMKRNAGSDTAFAQLPVGSRPAVADLPAVNHIVDMDWSPDGEHIAIATSQPPYVWLYKRTGDVFSRITTIPTLIAPPGSVEFSPDGTYLLFGRPVSMWKRGGDVYSEVAAPDIGFNGLRASWSPSGDRVAAVSASGVVFYRRINDNLFRLDVVPSQTPYAGSQHIYWTSDSRMAFLSRNGTGAIAPFLRVFRFGEDDDYEEITPAITLPTAAVAALAIQPGTNLVIAIPVGSASVRYYRYQSTVGLFTLHQKYLAAGTGLADASFSPRGDTIHFTRAGNGEHRETETYALIDSVSFDTEAEPSEITHVTYSSTGRVVVYTRDNGTVGLAVRPAGENSDFINIRDLRGTFVSLYDRENTTYLERDYTIHPVGAKVTDIQISKTPVSFSYNVKLENEVPSARVGRIVYDIRDDKFLDMGAIWREGDVSSLFAYSPWESYFVNVTLNNSDGVSSIRLYKLGGTPDLLTYEQVDVEDVLYGPPTFSNCDTVVVAHGGPTPFTLFARIADELVYRNITITDWESEEFIVAVAFTEDCTGLIIVLPDKVVVVGEDPDTPDEWKPTDEVPIDPVDDDDDRDIDIDDELVVINDPDDPKPPFLGDYDPDDKTLDDITYIPYVSVSVTYRTW